MTSFLCRAFMAFMVAFLLLGANAMPAEARAPKAFKETGTASWYGAWHHGKVTANGESYDMFAMTAAHKTIPLGSIVKVTRKATGKSIIVRINDRGPYKKRRIIDLSYAAASSLGMKRKGVSRVQIEVVSDKQGRLLSDKQEFYVHLQDTKPSLQAVQHQLGRLVRLGMNDASSLLHIHGGTMAMGPFADFEAAPTALTRVATTHPGASIILAEKGSMKPAVRNVATR
jgi:rare lipoprotein A